MLVGTGSLCTIGKNQLFLAAPTGLALHLFPPKHCNEVGVDEVRKKADTLLLLQHTTPHLLLVHFTAMQQRRE